MVDAPYAAQGSFADRAAVSALYRILLGRHPESEALFEEHKGRSLASLTSLIMQSLEFENLIRAVESGRSLPHFHSLAGSDLDESATWLAQWSDAPPEGHDWWSMMDIVLAAASSETLAGHGPFAERVRQHAHGLSAMSPALEHATVFDEAWYRRANSKAGAAIDGGGFADARTYFLERGRYDRDQLLAGFSTGLEHAYASLPDEASFDDAIAAIARSARLGLVAHWLFSADFYADTKRNHPAASSGERALVPYLDFLERLSSAAVRPHPLFCGHSYANLNGLSVADATFNHYVHSGMFENLQTSTLFEPSFYAHLHPEVRIEISQGTVLNELHHFLTIGILEDARFSPHFDADFYRTANPDVESEIAAGIVPSATWHFVYRGLGQGRSPSRVFCSKYYSARYPHIDAEMTELGLLSALEHYLLLGRQRGYSGDVPLIERRASLDDGKVIFQRRAFRSLDRQSRSPLAFPVPGDKPIRLSIIVPVCGEAHHTARLLECAHYAASHLMAARGAATQLIVVDNGSRDETPELLAATSGITTIRFPEPIGYPRAIVAGIESVRGDFVLVTNNDVEFEPDAFARIIDLLTTDPTIGVLGGLVVLPNERVQDAGSFVDHGGITAGVGRDEDPWSAFVRGVHEVDYCAGCFFSFRLDDYHEIGGIDERYSPGYYEEVDFAFRMRQQLGKKAVVPSDLQVVHLEHGSFSSGATPVAIEPTIRRNRSRFLAKHWRSLTDRPSSTALLHDHSARPTGIARPRALVIVSAIPTAGDSPSAALLNGMAENDMPFELLALKPRADCDTYVDRRVNVIRGWLPGLDMLAIIRKSAGRFSHIIVVGLDNLRRFGPALAQATVSSGVSIICDLETLPLSAVALNEQRGSGMRADQIELVRAMVTVGPDVSLWLASTEMERNLLMRAGARRAVLIDWSGQEVADKVHIALVGCGGRANDIEDALAWCRATVITDVPGANRLKIDAILRTDPPEAVSVSIGLPDRRDALEANDTIVVIPPRLDNIREVLRLLGSTLPVLMMEHHRRRLEAELGATGDGLAVVAEADADTSYAGWIARLLADPSLVDDIVTAQRVWLADHPADCDEVDGPRVVALR